RPRCVSPRPDRRYYSARRPAAARDRPVQSQRHAATVSALSSLGLSGQAVSSDAARLGQSRRVVSAGSCRHVFAALLYEMSQVLNADLSDLAPPGSHYTHRVIDLAVRIVVEDGLPYRPASWHLWRDHRVFVPFATIQNGVEAGEKRPRRAWTPTSSTGL